MKFPQRLVIILVSGIILLLYILFLSDIRLQEIWTKGQMYKNAYINLPIHRYMNKRSVETDPQSCTSEESLFPNVSMSTFDLIEKTNYEPKSNGEYEIPSPDPGIAYGPHLEPLTVIVVPHSHNDPGWLRTVEEYYVYTTKNILNSMVKKLSTYPNMTFIWTETVFLSMWWNELEDDIKMQVRRLIRRGQLEITLGGWVMPDEASTTYYSIIDQLIEGHQWVYENLHVKPENSWAIDPFGHSGTVPYIWKKAGLDNMVIQRIHQATKGTLIKEKSLEFNWRQFWDQKGESDILCHVTPYMLYNIKYTCGPNIFVCLLFDFRVVHNERTASETITVHNVEVQSKYLYESYRRKASLYQYNTVLVPLGDDFRYNYPIEWDQQYQNYALLMNYMNSRKDWKINVRFGTLKDYFKAVRKTEKQKSENDPKNHFPKLSGDFFPYSDHNQAYWTGYYSTRPFDKRFCREVESNLRAADILNSFAFAYSKLWELPYKGYHEAANLLQTARRNLGLFLHHDAITGTAKPYVVQDYESKLHTAYNYTQKVMRMGIQTLLSKGKLASPNIFNMEVTRSHFQALSVKQPISVVDFGTNVVIFNSVAQQRYEFIHIIVDSDSIEVRNSKNEVIPYQLNPAWESQTSVLSSLFEIVFLTELSPLGIETYTLFKVEVPQQQFPARITVYNTEELVVSPEARFYQQRPRHSGNHIGPIVLENEQMKTEFSSKSGMLHKLMDKATGNESVVDVEFLAYKSQGSGAYIFYPSGEAKSLLHRVPVIRVIEGPLMSELQTTYANFQHNVKLYHHPGEQGAALHIQNVVDMHATNMKDKEIIMRIVSDVKNNNKFFTDQNGFQLIGRKTRKESRIETNYYPMTSMAVLEDETKRLTLHSGQSHGVASLKSGWLEVMLDRELVYDDERGLGEGVGDNKLTLMKFILQLEHKKDPHISLQSKFTSPSLLSLSINENLQQPLVKFFTQINTDILSLRFMPLQDSLPCDVSLVSFRTLITSDLQYNGTSLILYRRGFKCGYPTTGLQCSANSEDISLDNLLKDLSIKGLRETTLTHLHEKAHLQPSVPLELSPMELAAYIVTL